MDNTFSNLREADKLHTRVNSMDKTQDTEKVRIELELKIMQHYFAFSEFKVPFKNWIKEYLKDILLNNPTTPTIIIELKDTATEDRINELKQDIHKLNQVSVMDNFGAYRDIIKSVKIYK